MKKIKIQLRFNLGDVCMSWAIKNVKLNLFLKMWSWIYFFSRFVLIKRRFINQIHCLTSKLNQITTNLVVLFFNGHNTTRNREFSDPENSSENMTLVEAGVSWRSLVHVGRRYFSRRKHISVRTSCNGFRVPPTRCEVRRKMDHYSRRGKCSIERR